MMFDVCHNCSAGLSNDDWSHLDYWDNSGEAVGVAMASVEVMGMVAPVEPVSVGYFRCFVCGMDEVSGTVWERV